jgi:hypothetical protein
MCSCPCCPQPKTAARIGQLLLEDKNPVSAVSGLDALSPASRGTVGSVQNGARGSTVLPLSRALRLTIRTRQCIG